MRQKNRGAFLTSRDSRLEEALARIKDAKAHVQDNFRAYACAGALLAGIGLYAAAKDEQQARYIVPPISESDEVDERSMMNKFPTGTHNFDAAISAAAQRNSLPADYLSAVIRAESGFRHFSNGKVLTSGSGHKGIMQLGPDAIRFNNLVEYQSTRDKSLVEMKAGGLVGRLDTPAFSWSRAKSDPVHNIGSGARYLNNLKGMHSSADAWKLYENVAASYNVGPGAVRKAIERAGSDDFWIYSRHIEALDRKNDAKVRAYVRDFVADVMSWYYASSQFSFPVESDNISSRFGYRRSDRKQHNGIDIAPEVRGRNELVMAAADGLVKEAGRDGAKGNYIELQHGRPEWGLSTSYLHGRKLYVKPGQKVKKGQVIMEMGSTGSVRPHGAVNLHFSVYANSKPVDPLAVYYSR